VSVVATNSKLATEEKEKESNEGIGCHRKIAAREENSWI